MVQIISQEATDKPHKDHFDLEVIGSYSAALGLTLGGMIAGHLINKGVNKVRKTEEDNVLITGGMALSGLAGFIYLKPWWAKFLALGAASYYGLRTANIGLKAVSDATSTNGLAGLLPETVKAKIREYIPSLGDVSDKLASAENSSDFGDINFDDEPIKGVEEDQMQGLGDIGMKLL